MVKIINISRRDPGINYMLKKLDYADDSKLLKLQKVIINFNNIKFISISAISLLQMYLLDVKSKNENIEIDIINVNEKIERYLMRINFYKNLGIDKFENFIRQDQVGRFTNLEVIKNDDRFSVLSEIIEILVAYNEVTPDVQGLLKWSLGEVIDNVFEHADSELGCVLMAQKYKKYIEVCIVDRGIGIDRSLIENSSEDLNYKDLFHNKSKSEILEKATGKKITKGTGQGNGLYYTKKFIEINKGDMEIYSNEGRFLIEEGNYKKRRSIDNTPWKGTLIRLRVNKNDDQLSIGKVFGVNMDKFEEWMTLPVDYIDDDRVEFKGNKYIDDLW